MLLVVFGGETGQQIAPVLEQLNQGNTTEQVETRTLSSEEIEMGKMVSFMFANTEDVWHSIFDQQGQIYKEPTLELFDDQVQTKCGSAQASVGPFIALLIKRSIWICDFWGTAPTLWSGKGNFAIAYVLAHEVGHHIQNLLGTNAKVWEQQQGLSKKEANKLSVAQELQADFYAGVWAKHIQKYLEPKDIDIALSAAQAVGDDAIQKEHLDK